MRQRGLGSTSVEADAYDLWGSLMLKYELVIWWSDEDHRFVVEVPELAGCMADGETYAEAVSNAQEIMSEWLATAHHLGREIPAPRGRLTYA